MMLRVAAISVAAVLLAFVAILCAMGSPLYGLLIMLAAVTLLLVYERRRYKPLADRPPSGWRPTGERFVDPETNQPVEVWNDPVTGERSYVVKEPDKG
ncbi:hypothetical protein [Flavisphingomonas formosensis]|uniref:hypothetical protein n=1 Tax=Flavisphingomonas formosensis TaxID=861534 RepID=UPI0012FAAF92|nr:hypothetical protein [Sphingomonas formosensis]